MYVSPLSSSMYIASGSSSTSRLLRRSLSCNFLPAKPTPKLMSRNAARRLRTSDGVTISPSAEASARNDARATTDAAKPAAAPTSKANRAIQGSSIGGPTVWGLLATKVAPSVSASPARESRMSAGRPRSGPAAVRARNVMGDVSASGSSASSGLAV